MFKAPPDRALRWLILSVPVGIFPPSPQKLLALQQRADDPLVALVRSCMHDKSACSETRVNGLVKSGESADAITESLRLAVAFGLDIPVIRALLNAGANPSPSLIEWADKAANTACDDVEYVAYRKQTVAALLAAGADVNTRAAYGWTPLMTAANSGACARTAELLIEAGADRNLVNNRGQTALELAEQKLRAATQYSSNPAYPALVDAQRRVVSALTQLVETLRRRPSPPFLGSAQSAACLQQGQRPFEGDDCNRLLALRDPALVGVPPDLVDDATLRRYVRANRASVDLLLRIALLDCWLSDRQRVNGGHCVCTPPEAPLKTQEIVEAYKWLEQVAEVAQAIQGSLSLTWAGALVAFARQYADVGLRLWAMAECVNASQLQEPLLRYERCRNEGSDPPTAYSVCAKGLGGYNFSVADAEEFFEYAYQARKWIGTEEKRKQIAIALAMIATGREKVTAIWPGTEVQTSGSAKVTAQILRLTGATEWTVGAIWSRYPLTLRNGFQLTFTFRISAPNGFPDASGAGGGDGLAFVIQSEGSNPSGGVGGALGYEGISKSLAIEFDTWRNTWDPDANHISVQTRGAIPNSADGSFSLGSRSAPVDLSDGATHTARVVYVSPSLRVFLDGVLVVTATVDLTSIGGNSILDSNGRAWIGFTAATGAAWQVHEVLNWSISAGR